MKIYGVHEIKEFDQTLYDSFISNIKQKNKIEFQSIISNGSQFLKLQKIEADSLIKKDLYQPIQILYFEHDSLASYHANCYANGMSLKLNWNTNNRFSYFIPKTVKKTDLFSIKLNNFKQIYPSIDFSNNKKYTIIVFWTNMIQKVSLDAINTVINNINDFNKESECNLILINTDNFFGDL